MIFFSLTLDTRDFRVYRWYMELVLSNELIRLRRDAGRYRSLHQRALNRLDNEQARHAEKIHRLKTDYESRIKALSDEIIDLKKQIKTLQDLHFGKSSEKSVSTAGLSVPFQAIIYLQKYTIKLFTIYKNRLELFAFYCRKQSWPKTAIDCNL